MANLNDNVDVTVAVANTQQTGGSTTPAYAHVVPPTVTGHGERPEKFSGLDFKYWQQKMLFYLTTLGLAKYLQEEAPTLSEAEQDPTTVAAMPGAKKFLIGRFLDFKMVDSKKVMAQVQDVQLILHELAAEGMALVEEFQVGVIIEKLPPSWRDFKNYLKHKQKGMSLEDLIVRLRIEEDNRLNDKKGGYHMESKANVVEHSHKNGNQNKKRKLSGPGQSSRGKFKKKQPTRAHLTEVEHVTDDILDLDLCAVVSEINLVGSNPRQWWVDTVLHAMYAVTGNYSLLFKETSNGEQLYMGNNSTWGILQVPR
ncbi:hypothetical protein Acr_16g0010390 [Actinidia rufa]|uniref:Uncharacterized protein n=1 Tax=Actinidia rufa TaxID=165716 RepID=A0A7J0G0F1_9ERIC|nr:hypothetical protein Acr_16g0010390 [Actinidia rufa]